MNYLHRERSEVNICILINPLTICGRGRKARPSNCLNHLWMLSSLLYSFRKRPIVNNQPWSKCFMWSLCAIWILFVGLIVGFVERVDLIMWDRTDESRVNINLFIIYYDDVVEKVWHLKKTWLVDDLPFYISYDILAHFSLVLKTTTRINLWNI